MRKSAVTAAVREQAEQAVQRLRQAELEERAAELAEKARAMSAGLSEKAQPVIEGLTSKAQAKVTRAQERGSEFTNRGLRRLGEKLSESRIGRRLGLQPAPRRVPWWLVGLLGVAIGYAIALCTASRRESEVTADIEAHADWAAQPLVDTVRARIANDPRTSDLLDLKVDVANGTVFVRGVLPPNFDQNTLREVIEGVPGVHDIDLQVTAS